MKYDEFGRPLCLVWRHGAPCNTPVDPHYTICLTCKVPYGRMLIEEAEAWQRREAEKRLKGGAKP
jgi:hypothetical protein